VSRRRGRDPWTVRRYLALIAVTALVALTIGSWYGFTWAAGHDRAAGLGQLRFESTRSAESISSAIADAESTVNQLTAQQGLDRVFGSRAGSCNLAASGGGPFPTVRLDIVDADGQVGCSSSKARDVFEADVHSGSAWLRTGMQSTSATSVWIAKDAVSGQPGLVITAAVKSAAGKPVGAIALFLFTPRMAAALAHDYAASQQSSVFVVDATSGRVLSSSSTGASTAGLRDYRLLPRTSGEWAAPDGTQSLFASRAVVGPDWRVYVGVPASEVVGAARGALLRAGVVGVVAVLLLVAALLILNRRVAGPLRAVTAAVVSASRDASTTRVRPAGTAELVALAREVNVMLDVRAGFDAQLRHQATHDSLTGLANEVLLRERLEQALGRPGFSQVAILCVGIDRFPTLNDALGPDATDRVIVEVATRLGNALHPEEFLARYRGNQFVVLCEQVEAADDAVVVVSRLRAVMDQPFHPSADPVAVSVSVGIALNQRREGTPSVSQLLRDADSALHQALTAGREWTLSDPTQQARATHYLHTQHALHQAIDDGELEVHYQPLLDVATGRVTGAEALVRWRHPTRGLVPPMEFIPVAEETGQVNDIGAFVLREACLEAARWNQRENPVTVSVNIAVGQLRDPGFASSVQRALRAADLPPSRLCLEVTESAMMRVGGVETNVLARLRRLGVRLAIDDFGTGYSSLSYLHELPVDELKIDRSFISRIARGQRHAHLVETILRMAHGLGLDVVAEGVETQEQLDLLADLGCQKAQGYLFSPPVPAGVFRAEFVRAGGQRAVTMVQRAPTLR
jgi:diguanylate cyclase (GGDEF)-like protein